jgi:hypothetical protein
MGRDEELALEQEIASRQAKGIAERLGSEAPAIGNAAIRDVLLSSNVVFDARPGTVHVLMRMTDAVEAGMGDKDWSAVADYTLRN